MMGNLATASEVAWRLIRLLEPSCARIEIAGSVRRGKATVKDVEIVAISRTAVGPNDLNAHLDRLLNIGAITKARYGHNGGPRWGPTYRGLIYQSMRVEIFQAQPHTWGYIHWLRTGPSDANTYVMSALRWHNAPFACRDGAVMVGDRVVNVPDERTMFALLGMPYVEPKERTLERYQAYLMQPRWPTINALTFVDMPAELQQGSLF